MACFIRWIACRVIVLGSHCLDVTRSVFFHAIRQDSTVVGCSRVISGDVGGQVIWVRAGSRKEGSGMDESMSCVTTVGGQDEGGHCHYGEHWRCNGGHSCEQV